MVACSRRDMFESMEISNWSAFLSCWDSPCMRRLWCLQPSWDHVEKLGPKCVKQRKQNPEKGSRGLATNGTRRLLLPDFQFLKPLLVIPSFASLPTWGSTAWYPLPGCLSLSFSSGNTVTMTHLTSGSSQELGKNQIKGQS